MQLGVQQMSCSMIAHGIHAPYPIHFGNRQVAYLGRTLFHDPDVNDDPGCRAANFVHVHHPTAIPGSNGSGIAGLPTRFDIEAGGRQDHFHGLADQSLFQFIPFTEERQHLTLAFQPLVGVISHPARSQFFTFDQFFKRSAVNFHIFAPKRTKGLAGTRLHFVFFHRSLKTLFVHVQLHLTGHITGQLKG